MSAFRPKGFAYRTRSKERRAMREQGGKAGVRFDELCRSLRRATERRDALPEGSRAWMVAAFRAQGVNVSAEHAQQEAEAYRPDYRAEKGKGIPADYQPTKRRARKNPRWAGILAGLRHHGHPYAVVAPPQKKRRKKVRTAPKMKRPGPQLASPAVLVSEAQHPAEGRHAPA